MIPLHLRTKASQSQGKVEVVPVYALTSSAVRLPVKIDLGYILRQFGVAARQKGRSDGPAQGFQSGQRLSGPRPQHA